MYSKQPRKGEGEGIEGGGEPRRIQWKLEILVFLSARSETGAGRRDIIEHCLGLIRAGTLVAAAPADDRPRVDRIVYMYLCAMKKAGEVVRAPGKVYFATVRGLAWLERHPAPVTPIRQPDKPAPGG
jgi:hypothetical protein